MDVSARTIIVSLLSVLAAGTVFFRHVEGWDWIDAYFFTVITVSTVGYGNLVPATALGKIGTTVLIFVGLGVFAVAIHRFANYHMRKREEHTEWLFALLGQKEEEAAPANEDEAPEPPDAVRPGG